MKSYKKLLSAVLALALTFSGIAIPTEVQAAGTNLAQGKTAEASAAYNVDDTMLAGKAVDGDLATRWSSEAGPLQWLKVDLETESEITGFRIAAEDNEAQKIAQFLIEGSNDDSSYEEIYQSADKSADGGFALDYSFDLDQSVNYRYVRITIQKLITGAWPSVSLREFGVFGVAGETGSGNQGGSTIIATENVNHVRTATMSASSVEASTDYGAANANDGDASTRWASRYPTSNAGEKETQLDTNPWLQADFEKATQIQHIKVKFFRRNAAPEPSNVTQFSIMYKDAAGNELYAEENISRSGDNLEVSVALDSPIVATSIRICDIETVEGATWNNIGIAELEAYSNVIEAGSVTSLDDVVEQLESISGAVVEASADTFVLPEVPEGYEIALNGADFEQIIGDNLTVVHPLTDKTVQVSYKVTETATNETAITDDITYLVEGKNTQAEGNAKPVVIPEIQEWYSNTTDKLTVSSITKVTYNDDALAAVVDEFIADYKDFTGKELTKIKGEPEANAFNFTKEAPDALLGEEGYTMDILADRVNVKSESVTGNMYGMQTILQMYKQNAEEFSIGQMRDYPRFEVRGFSLDIARKPIGMNMISDIGRTMRYYKMNDYQIHLSDNLIFLEAYGCYENEDEAFKAYEAFRLESSLTNEAGESPTAKDYYITKADMREYIQSQRALGMNIVPEIDLPAHATSFTKVWPELAVQNKVSPLNGSRPLIDHFDVSRPEAVNKIKEIFDDYTKGETPTFDGETVVHVGADEFVDSYTAYREFLNTIVPYVKETNTVRMWGGLTWLDDGKTEIIPEAIENVQVDLWSKDWADGVEMYDMGYDLINIIDTYGYMVPNGNGNLGAYADYLNVNSVFSSFEANKVSSSQGWVSLPSGDDQVLGAAFAIWSDNIDKYASGLTESDLYHRFFDALPFYAEKTWAATGQEKGSAATLTALAQVQGIAPRTNPYYQEDKTGEAYESYDFENLEDGSENGRDLTAGTATVEDGVLKLTGDNSYVTTPIDKLGNGNELSFDITLTEIAKPGDIIFEATPEYGTHDIRVMEDGRLGFTRELYNYYFDYELPVDKEVNIRIVAEQQDTTLYVDGELIGEATGKFIHNDMVKKEGLIHSTFAIPLERIGSETNAIAAEIDNVVVREAELDIYNKAAWTGTTDSETEYNETEGLLEYAFDNNSGTIWHSNWANNANDKLTGSNSFYAEIDFGQAYTINQFSFTPRTPQDSGRVTKADLYIKGPNDSEWELVAEDAEFAADETTKTFMFAEEQDVRYVKFVAKASSDGWVAISEFDIANKQELLCTVYVEAETGGNVTGGIKEVSTGTNVTVTATATEGYLFDGWYNNLGVEVSADAEYTFEVQKNTALMAKFVEDETYVPETDKNELQDAVDEAYDDEELSQYTEESVDAYKEALKKAKEVLADPNATQDEVEEAIDALGEAKDALEDKTDVKPEDTEAPTAPKNLKAEKITKDSVTIVWDASEDNKGVAGYKVFVDGKEIGIVDTEKAVINNLKAGTAYKIEIKAVDEAGNESDAALLEVTTDKAPSTGQNQKPETNGGSNSNSGTTNSGSGSTGSSNPGAVTPTVSPVSTGDTSNILAFAALAFAAAIMLVVSRRKRAA